MIAHDIVNTTICIKVLSSDVTMTNVAMDF